MIISTPIGSIRISTDDKRVNAIDILARKRATQAATNQFDLQVQRQLQDYFENPLQAFSLPLLMQGTKFQQQVWQILQKIPPGKVLTYGEVAKRLKSSARAVGNACRANPIPLIVPCHRVVGANGPGGYGGKTAGRRLAIKCWLLRHEGAGFSCN